MKLNMNTRVRVALTADGIKRHDAWVSHYPEHLRATLAPKDGVLELELWRMASIFGDYLYNGGPTLFVNNELELISDVKPAGWLITTPTADHSWFEKSQAVVAQFQQPGQRHTIEQLFKKV